jgi:hypothetical protein
LYPAAIGRAVLLRCFQDGVQAAILGGHTGDGSGGGNGYQKGLQRKLNQYNCLKIMVES